jgi:catechol 2,3-dioxygenase-like lactoylglutathione lyase family enzyme
VPTTTGFNHVATLTPDLGRLVEFYARTFGAEVTFETEATPDHPRMVVLDLGGPPA